MAHDYPNNHGQEQRNQLSQPIFDKESGKKSFHVFSHSKKLNFAWRFIRGGGLKILRMIPLKRSIFTPRVMIPSLAMETFPVSSETTMTSESVIWLKPSPALWRVPIDFASCKESSAKGKITAAARIFLSLKITAPS